MFDLVSDVIECFPYDITNILCDYTYEIKYAVYHNHTLEHIKHSGIYSSICYDDYLVELIDDVCFVKNAFTNELIKQQTITNIKSAIDQYVNPGVIDFTFHIKCDKVYYGDRLDYPIFCVGFDLDEHTCYIKEFNDGEKLKDNSNDDNQINFYDNNESSHDIYNESGWLICELYEEIKEKLFKKLCETINFKSMTLIDINPNISGISATNLLVDNVFCADSFNCDYLNVYFDVPIRLGGKYYGQTHQICTMKRIVC